MKKMKKLMTLLAAALVAVLALGTIAMAADDGTIKIQNTVKDKVYTAYKVFDATYSGSAVSYTYDGSDADFLAALQAETSPFTCTAATAGGYVITLKNGKTKEDVATFLKTNESHLGTAKKAITGNGETQTMSGLAYGYYYITTTTGSIVTIDTVAKDATVIDKNENITGPDKKESAVPPATATDNDWVDDTTLSIGDTINYKVNATYSRYVGETLVTTMNFIDTMSPGLTPTKDVVVTVKDPDGTSHTLTKVDSFANQTDKVYEVTYDGQTSKVNILTAYTDDNGIHFLYDTGAVIEIQYTATLNENAAINVPKEANGANKNTVVLRYNHENNVGSDTTTIESYEIDLNKVDSSTNKLPGAKFRLYDAKTAGNEIPVVLVPKENQQNYGTVQSAVDNVYRRAKTGETGVEIVVGQTGKVKIVGLENGSYFFEETEAPDGYNKLTERTEAVVINDANATVNVVNEGGSLLPSTGGIGTTLFYIIGAILVIVAGIILVTRKKVQQ